MGNEITFGVINGLLELTLAGKAAEKKKKEEEAKAKAEAITKGKEALVSTLTGNAEVASNFMNNMANFPIYSSLDPFSQSAIASAAGQSFETAEQKRWIEQSKDPAVARGYLMDNRLLDNPNFQQVMPTIVQLAAPTYSKQEMEIIKEVAGKHDKAQAFLETGMYAPGTPMHAYLSSIPQEGRTYTKLTSDVFTQVKDTLGKDAVAGLKMVNGLIASVQPYAKDNDEANRDLIRLNALRSSFAMADFSAESQAEAKLLEALDLALEINEDMDEGARQPAALAHVAQAQQLVSELGLPADSSQWSPEVQSRYAALVALSQMSDDIKDNVYSYASSNQTGTGGNDALSIRMDENQTIESNPDNFLDKLNRYTGAQLNQAFGNMSELGQQKFKADVRVALARDIENRNQDKIVGPQGQTIPANPRNYPNRFPNLYALSFFPNMLHNQFGFPRPGGTQTGENIFPEQVDDAGAALPPDQIRVTPTRVITASQHLVDFATAKDSTPQQLLNTDDGYAALLDIGGFDGAPDRLYEAVNIINQNGIFYRVVDKDISSGAMNSVAYTLARTGVNERGQQLDVIAANLSGDIPRKYKPNPMDLTISEDRMMNFVREATGMNLDIKDVAKAKENAETFLNQLARANELLGRLGPGSRLTDIVTSQLQNLFFLEGSLLEVATQGGLRIAKNKLLGLVKIEDMSNDIGSANENREAVLEQVNNYMETSWAKANAQLASLYVTMAYSYAKTMDPSGRISERDFASALEAVSGDLTAPRTIQEAVIGGLMRLTQDNLLRNERAFGFILDARQGNNRSLQPTRSQIRAIRSLRYMNSLIRATQGLDRVEEYQKAVDEGTFKTKFKLDSAATMFPNGVARKYRIVEVKFRGLSGPPQKIMGGLYADSSDGRILTTMEIQRYKEESRNP